MSTNPSNANELRPQNRYTDTTQGYYFESPLGDEIRLTREDGAELIAIPELGISAGEVYIDGVPLTFHGALFVRSWLVNHKPNERRNGTIEINTPYEERQ